MSLSGVNDMWIIETDTGTARRTVVGRGLADNPVWAPDSAHLAFSRTYDTPPKLFVRGLGEKDADEALPEDYFQAPPTGPATAVSSRSPILPSPKSIMS